MKAGDYIEVLRFENGALDSMRRIRLTFATRRTGGWRVAGVNMRGEHPVEYNLRLYPMDCPPDNGIAWVPCDRPVTIDE